MEVSEIKQILKQRKINYIELSKMSGIPLQSLRRIFSGATPNPRNDTMQAIERALGLAPTAEEMAQGVSNYNLTEDQDELLILYNALGDKLGKEAQKSLILYIKFLLEANPR